MHILYWRMLTLEGIKHADHKSRPFNKVNFLTSDHSHLLTYNSKNIFFNLFSIDFHILGFPFIYDMQSEIHTPHTTILNISLVVTRGHS